MKRLRRALMCLLLAASSTRCLAEDAAIRIDAAAAGKPVSPYLAGACIEDVNHEIYGGIYSQMIFGESFQEPAATSPAVGFQAFDGTWEVKNGELLGGEGSGPTLVSTTIEPFANGEVGVDLFLPAGGDGNAGLIVNVNQPSEGADEFNGYEIAISANKKTLMLGRHQHNFKMLNEVPCEVATERWIHLSAMLSARSIQISIDGKMVLEAHDERPLKAGVVGVRQWRRPARYKNLWVKTGEKETKLAFVLNPHQNAVSGMWVPLSSGTAKLQAAIQHDRPFIGVQSQRIAMAGGDGEVGIANLGLNRGGKQQGGLAFVAGKPYEGYLWLRAERATDVLVTLENRDGSERVAEQRLKVEAGDWRKHEVSLTPAKGVAAGRFAIRLKSPGAVVDVGHAFLQPGTWGRFKDLPLRKDVVDGMIDQGITVLRYGGSMVNNDHYRWKTMIGPRDSRPPYKGLWYPYSTNGWGIVDFLDLCEAAGFLGIPDFNIDERPADMVDFIEYAFGDAQSKWGKVRVADGHPKPYDLKYLELGNEECVDDAYFTKFAGIAKAIWAKAPTLTLIVGDFTFHHAIVDPMKFDGAESGITTMAAYQKILSLAKENDREVWFDYHVATDKAERSEALQTLPTYIDALGKLAEGARHQVVVFELNAGNHLQRRAIGNALALGVMTRDGRLPIVLSANCLQPDGQNDNGWDQGLLFLNPSRVWLQPPGYVTQMIARSYEPIVVPAELLNADGLDVTALRSADGRAIVLRVANLGGSARAAKIEIGGFKPTRPSASVTELAAALEEANTAANPDRVTPKQKDWPVGKDGVPGSYTFPPNSFTVMKFE